MQTTHAHHSSAGHHSSQNGPAVGHGSGQRSTAAGHGSGHAGTGAALRLGCYEIDTSRSSVRFRTRHLFGLAPVRGTFAIASGTVGVAEPLAGSIIHAEIDVASFRTRSRLRNATVLSSRFLDAARHPFILFDTEKITGSTIEGTLTACGRSRPVRLAVEDLTVSSESFTARAVARIDRTEFGVTASPGLAGRYLDLTIEVRCVRS